MFTRSLGATDASFAINPSSLTRLESPPRIYPAKPSVYHGAALSHFWAGVPPRQTLVVAGQAIGRKLGFPLVQAATLDLVIERREQADRESLVAGGERGARHRQP